MFIATPKTRIFAPEERHVLPEPRSETELFYEVENIFLFEFNLELAQQRQIFILER